MHLDKRLTKKDIINMNADAVICATGITPVKLNIEGAEKGINATDILRGTDCGKNAVIIGGGIIPNAVYEGYTVGKFLC